ncbi:beta-ketoacyl synthase N-terminal-like domain-containing protein [Amycolatopsis alba]|uniref:Beta-ketoacyl synthase-like N-terminal domain-containing protein n=1 Tax=Amycolatopsis alba DSM 44262 TaxID=1125972 RepID=A0A229S8N5_AMYAL|nr:beta-ketoacyl synthase N-terminal-like domain-containing protein [Amycolatopsis alba]OXM54944.1 hypothetical protein CFP75_02050 [Amycolatopsis alba DSM 44262]
MNILAAATGSAATAPPVAGFIESPFNPLVHQVATTLLGRCAVDGARTGMVLASELGDSVTTDLASRQLAEGKPANTLLFMQATANAILGRIGIEHGITGPALSISPSRHAGHGPLDLAALLLEDDLDRILVLGVELTGTPRTDAAHRARGTESPPADLAAGLLVGPGSALTRPYPDDVAGLLALARSATTTAPLGRAEGEQP